MPTPNLDVFQVIADPSRRQILQLLTQGRYNVNSLSENFDMSRPAVSKHIKILQNAGFVSIEVNGRDHYCVLNQDGFKQIKSWMDYFDNFWNNKLKNLEVLLNAQKTKH